MLRGEWMCYHHGEITGKYEASCSDFSINTWRTKDVPAADDRTGKVGAAERIVAINSHNRSEV